MQNEDSEPENGMILLDRPDILLKLQQKTSFSWIAFAGQIVLPHGVKNVDEGLNPNGVEPQSVCTWNSYWVFEFKPAMAKKFQVTLSYLELICQFKNLYYAIKYCFAGFFLYSCYTYFQFIHAKCSKTKTTNNAFGSV